MCYITSQQHIKLWRTWTNVTWCFRQFLFSDLFHFHKIAQPGQLAQIDSAWFLHLLQVRYCAQITSVTPAVAYVSFTKDFTRNGGCYKTFPLKLINKWSKSASIVVFCWWACFLLLPTLTDGQNSLVHRDGQISWIMRMTSNSVTNPVSPYFI